MRYYYSYTCEQLYWHPRLRCHPLRNLPTRVLNRFAYQVILGHLLKAKQFVAPGQASTQNHPTYTRMYFPGRGNTPVCTTNSTRCKPKTPTTTQHRAVNYTKAIPTAVPPRPFALDLVLNKARKRGNEGTGAMTDAQNRRVHPLRRSMSLRNCQPRASLA